MNTDLNIIFRICKIKCTKWIVHGKDDFAEGSKILLDKDLTIILLEPQKY